MALSRSDEIDLLTALHDGPHEESRWATFLARLRRRTLADHVALIVGHGDPPVQGATRWSAGPNLPAQPDAAVMSDPALRQRLRPGRVYAASELVDPANAGHGQDRDSPARIGRPFGRFMRTATAGGPNGWLILTRAAADFSAADSALLSSLSAHLAIALRTLVALERARFRDTVAGDALGRAGIGWAALDRAGRVIDAGGAALAGKRPGDLLAVPLPAGPPGAVAMPEALVLGRDATEPGAHTVAALECLFRLTPSEARLAARLAGGDSIAGAAAALGLTIETARNYSKRLFAKTGTRGQADLVRLVLTSVAGLA